MSDDSPAGLTHILAAVEALATIAFAVSGLLEAARKRLDAVGVCMVAGLAAFGGGTLRTSKRTRRSRPCADGVAVPPTGQHRWAVPSVLSPSANVLAATRAKWLQRLQRGLDVRRFVQGRHDDRQDRPHDASFSAQS